MRTNAHNLADTQALVAVARVAGHRAGYAWCDTAESFSFMPTTKHQRLREPSHG